MRILQVIPYFAPAWAYGGPPKVFYDMAVRLSKRGHEVTVYTSDAFDAHNRIAKRWDELDGVKVYYFPNLSNWLAWKHKIFLARGFAKKLKQTIGQFDLVHVAEFRTYQSAVTYQQTISQNVPYLLSAFGQLPRGHNFKRPLKAIYDQVFGYKILRRASRVLAQTEDEAQEYERFGVPRKRVALIPLGIDLSEFEPLPPRGLFRQRFSIPEDAPMVLFLGRLHAYKGLDLLVRAFQQVTSQLPEGRLVIVGRDDGYLSRLQALITELSLDGRVILTGPLYGQDRIPAYVDADLFALTPSHAEQTSLAALEACAAGTPVVVTRQAPIPWLEKYDAGLTVPYSAPKIAEAVVSLLQEPGWRAHMGDAARRLVCDRFAWPRVMEALEGLYWEVTCKR